MTTLTSRPIFRRLPARASIVLVPMFLSFFMSGIVSLIATMRSLGLSPDLPQAVLHAWMLSYPVAFPAALIVLPFVRRIVGFLVEPAGR